MAYIEGISLEGLLITRYNTPYRGAPPNKKKEALVGCAEQAVSSTHKQGRHPVPPTPVPPAAVVQPASQCSS